MSGGGFSRLNALFQQAIELPQGERADFVARACADDAALRDRLLRMLEQDARADQQSTDRLGGAIAAGRRAVADSPRAPERIGPFRILRRLGQGGMGTVYLGEREGADFSQRVAIKLLRGISGQDPDTARLRRERRLLARLEHPHIARLVDGGELDDGTPFVAMEYIEGDTLLRHAQARGLGIADRLRLFDQLLEAVAYAHRHLIVHRDIKPENVLVDADGQLKLLDFGIAKLLDDDDAQASGATQTVAGAMTPCYASPEQLQGQAVSTQSDLYSLGVVLYELLTGQLPFPPDPSISPLALQQRICTTQPVAPSRVVQGSAPRRRLRGDLDNIVLKALRKEPQRRYASVDALADDLRRHREGRPVSARPDSLWYRSAKFAARNPLAVIASLALFGTLLTFALVSRWQAEQLAAERDRAEGEAAAANQVAQYMVGLFKVADPLESANTEVSARELLDRAAATLPQELPEAPQLRARLMHVIGLSYASNGAYQPAVAMMEAALAVREVEFGDGSFEVSDTLNRLGNIHRMYGRLDLAEPPLREALRIREALPRPPDTELADSYNNVGLLQYELGQHEAALVTLQRSIDLHREVSVGDTVPVAIALHNKALALNRLGRFVEAEGAVRESIAIKLAQGLEGRATTVNTEALLALLLFNEGRLGEAAAIRDRTLTRRRELYPDGHPALVSGLVNAADLERLLGDAAASRKLLDEAGEWAVRIDSASGLQQARVDAALARWALAVGNADMALQRAEASLARRNVAFDDGHPERLESLRLLGVAELAAGRMDEAREAITAVQRLREDNLPPAHPDRIEAELDLAALALAEGVVEAARARLQSLIEGAGAAGGLAADLSRALAARCLAVQATPDQARLHWDRAGRLLAPFLAAGHPLRQPGRDRCPGIGWLPFATEPGL
jgi:serine/threonine-protein kinase